MGRSRVRKPTLAEKMLISGAKLKWPNWLVLRETTEGLVLVHRGSGKLRTIKNDPVSCSSKGQKK